MDNVYYEFTALLALSAVIGTFAIRLRQPLIVAFILVGILVGPVGLGWVRSHEQIELLAEIGVTVLLFVVGLKLDPGLVRHLGGVALATGLGQLAFTIAFGYGISRGLGMDHLKALYVAVALTFSSTIIIIKLLSDKREIDTLHGRIAVGFLIVQDIAVIVAMMVIGSSSLADTAGQGWAGTLGSVLLRLLLMIAVIGALMRFVLPVLMRGMAASQELLLLFAVAWGTALAVAGELLGFSKEVGAFLAGFSLATSPYREAVASRLASLRDFLLLFFFIELGSGLHFGVLGEALVPAVVLSVFVLVGNPLIVMAIMGYMGYRKRTGFLAGLTVAQISEFSIVFVAMGIQLGHVDDSALALTTLVGLVTITLSTYLILYSEPLYRRLAPVLGLFERQQPMREMAIENDAMPDEADVVVFGLGRYGLNLAQRLQENGLRVLGVDFDPALVQSLAATGFTCRFGDAENTDFLEHVPLMRASCIVSALPDLQSSLHLLRWLKSHGFAGRCILRAHTEHEGVVLLAAGADEVLYPFRDAADFASNRVVGLLARHPA
ncbi:MAG: sodium:proton exchanger [Gammaproteobacteria bacterium]|nr:MAG: sodium:proton exchanger [Gammaproteobacteria bacterium]